MSCGIGLRFLVWTQKSSGDMIRSWANTVRASEGGLILKCSCAIHSCQGKSQRGMYIPQKQFLDSEKPVPTWL